MNKNRFELRLVYKCGKFEHELYHHLLTDETAERVVRVVRSMLSRILRVGSFDLALSELPEDEQLFQPSFSSFNAVQGLCYDMLNILASFSYGK